MTAAQIRPDGHPSADTHDGPAVGSHPFSTPASHGPSPKGLAPGSTLLTGGHRCRDTQSTYAPGDLSAADQVCHDTHSPSVGGTSSTPANEYPTPKVEAPGSTIAVPTERRHP